MTEMMTHIHQAIEKLSVFDQTLKDKDCAFEVRVDDGHVHVIVESDGLKPDEYTLWRERIETALASLAGVRKVTVVMTAPRAASQKGPLQKKTPQVAPPQSIPGVKCIVAVASGKGGVGKSTVAVNLAVALQKQGLKIGLLDADIYGPSLPTMMNVHDKPQATPDKRLRPLLAHGIVCMSLGLMMEHDAPVIWRGLMVQSAMKQMLRDVDWGELDVLVVDMPPGTGDAHITLAQTVPLQGAVIVTTPQDLALIDAMRALHMFKRMQVPILGFVENMSVYVCPKCGHEDHVFAHGGVAKQAQTLGVQILGEIPLDPALRKAGDDGAPIGTTQTDAPLQNIFSQIAQKVRHQLGI